MVGGQYISHLHRSVLNTGNSDGTKYPVSFEPEPETLINDSTALHVDD
jgi:hypothetical protein